jgi:glycosyltransferase involved in cell wall biosynthesis
MNTPDISIVVPVYQAEKYLEKCICSILSQSYENWELLLIDDGSTDRSVDMCDLYAKADSRIKVFHKTNGGVSSARQMGLDNVNGTYIIHIDPDDWIDSNMLECLYKKAKNDDSDMVICDYYWEKGSRYKIVNQMPLSLNAKDVLADLFRYLHGSVCNKLVKVETCRKYQVKFPTNINLYEDLIFNIELLKNPIKVSYVNNAFYHYVQNINTNSLTRRYTVETLQRDRNIGEYIVSIVDGYVSKELYSVYLNSIILQRAFFSGFFSSKEFRQYFFHKKKYILKATQINYILRFVIYISCIGLYRPIYRIIDFLRGIIS